MKIALKISANKTQKATRPIYLCIIYDRLHQNKINTGIEVSPDQWDAVRQKVINHPAAKVYNANLSGQVSEIKNQIAKEFEDRRLEELRLLPKKMQQELGLNKRQRAKPKPVDFLAYMIKSISESTELKYSSVVAQMSVYHRLSALYGELPFDRINHAWLLDFERRCLEANLSRGTIWKYHKDIKKYLHRAALEGVYTYPQGKHPYADFKVQRSYNRRDHLTTAELQKLEAAELSPALDRVRRMFLFLCYTGLRISDFCRLDKSMMDSFGTLKIMPQKTETTSFAEVALPLKELFAGKPYKIWETFGFEFPNKSISFSLGFNKDLKLLAHAVQINKHLSAHVGRHTFLTQIALRTGNVFTVMMLGGIKKVDTAQVYIHLSAQEHALDNINWN